MYNYIGLSNDFSHAMFFGIIALAGGIITSRLWKKENLKNFDKVSCLIIGIICAIYEFSWAADNYAKMQEQTPESYTGYFVNEQNANRIASAQIEYYFKNDSGGGYFHLTGEDKKSVFPERFEAGQWYTIYYEDTSGGNIIVGVEKTDSPSE
ncbi:MAG: hypothetical protein IJA17_00555 [Oscillospiraceae bacterium]|nr:hypothetical protein [Oscillospiraceae bacterium]